MFFRSFGSLAKKIALGVVGVSLGVYCVEKKNTVYIWGNGYYHPRPDALLQFQNFTPKHIDNMPEQIKQIEFGYHYYAGIDYFHNLYIWSPHQIDANLDYNSVHDHKRHDIVLLARKVTQVKFTTGFIWTLTTDNEVIQYPINKKLERKVVVATKLGTPRTVSPLAGTIQLETGNDHVLTLKKDGNVYAMGDDSYGQCGQPIENRPTGVISYSRYSTPVKVTGLHNIKKIAAAGNHCLALDNNGTVFGWGSNSLMQLSHEYYYSKLKDPLLCVYSPLPIRHSMYSNLVIDIVAGRDFNFFITENIITKSHYVFSTGNNLNGQLCIGEIAHLRDIIRVDALSNYVFTEDGKETIVKVDQMRCGNSHCIALLNVGYVMSWGGNYYGQLGNQKRSLSKVPVILKMFNKKKVTGVFAGQYSSAVIVEEELAKAEGKYSKG